MPLLSGQSISRMAVCFTGASAGRRRAREMLYETCGPGRGACIITPAHNGAPGASATGGRPSGRGRSRLAAETTLMRANPVKKALKAGQPSVGTWLSLGSITAARFFARAGFAWLTVDVEHSLVDWETATHMFASIADAGCVALARVPSNRHDHIKRVLDNGAQGIVVPMVNSRQEAEDAISAALYPPRGTRSVGGSVHALNFQA